MLCWSLGERRMKMQCSQAKPILPHGVIGAPAGQRRITLPWRLNAAAVNKAVVRSAQLKGCL
jgi:hypothetical protein